MIKEIKMPAGGQTTDVSKIANWLVKVGDKVKRGTELLEIETDKATLTVESFAKGTVLALLVNEGDEASAGDVIAYIGDESDRDEVAQRLGGGGGAAPAPKQEAAEDEEDEYQPIDKNAPKNYVKKDQSAADLMAEKPAAEKAVPDDIKAMPNAKLAAKENGVSLADVAAYTGKNVLKRADVLDYVENAEKAPATAGEAAASEAPAAPAAVRRGDERIPLTKMRKAIAVMMEKSTQTIPAFQVATEIEMDACIAFRKLINAVPDRKVSYNDILFKCMEAAIRKYPMINASYEEDAIVVHHDINIGLAVAVDAGLLVPVCKNVEQKTISEISEINKANIAKARMGKFAADDMRGGTITLSNLGMYPVSHFTAIINPPEACILAIGGVKEKLVMKDGKVEVIHVMEVTASFDHRVIDGAYGAGFLKELKAIVENPALALV